VSAPRPGALAGIRVIELARLLPGNLAAQMLGDLGADVIKVEQPGAGDPMRDFPPMGTRDSGVFLISNRNKRSITVDLKKPEGRAIVEKLAAGADVVLEGFRPGVADRLGVGDAALRTINPRLVYCALSGYGQTGPYRLVPGHDMNYLGIVGMLQLMSRRETGPFVPGPLIADIAGGSLMAVYGILAALLARTTTGEGQFVDVSMTDGAMALMVSHMAEWLYAGHEPRGGEYRNAGGSAPYEIYRCADGKYLTLGIIEDHFWLRLRQLLGRDDLPAEPFPGPEDAARAHAILTEAFATASRDEWVARLWQADISAGPVNSFAEAAADPQMRAREMVFEIDHPVEGRIPQLGFPVKFSATPGAVTRPPPGLGEHNGEVLTELGYSAEAIADLARDGTIG
jgi:crotonobetainyl-CoA:carnitine CoA-transferase CaiB-like acyl-CoA transferase